MKKTTKTTKRGGRKPGAWRPGLSVDSLRAFREDNHVSRARLAKMIGVSATTIQNWELGLVFPTNKNQDQLQHVMKNPSAVMAVGASVQGVGSSVGSNGRHSDVEMTVIGQIVSAYLAANGKLVAQEDLCGIVRSVRAALA